MQQLSICLWYDDQAEEAAQFYTSVFKDGKILNIARYETQTPSNKEIGSVLTVEFEVNGMNFLALNGGPAFKFNEAVSIVINCDTQEEIDYFHEQLSADPSAEQCGWVKDKFGVSWQVNATALNKMLLDPDKEKVKRVTEVMLEMKKLDIAELEKAFNG